MNQKDLQMAARRVCQRIFYEGPPGETPGEQHARTARLLELFGRHCCDMAAARLKREEVQTLRGKKKEVNYNFL